MFEIALSKEQWSAPFAEHPAHRFLSKKIDKNEMVKQINLSTNGFHQKDFLKVAVLNHSTLIIVFWQQKVSENEIFK